MDRSETDFEKLRAFAREQAADAAEYRLQVEYLLGENKKLVRRLNKVYRSWTWRVGRVVLFPFHLVMWAIDRTRRKRAPL